MDTVYKCQISDYGLYRLASKQSLKLNLQENNQEVIKSRTLSYASYPVRCPITHIHIYIYTSVESHCISNHQYCWRHQWAKRLKQRAKILVPKLHELPISCQSKLANDPQLILITLNPICGPYRISVFSEGSVWKTCNKLVPLYLNFSFSTLSQWQWSI